MTGFSFGWHGLRLEARCSGALWLPDQHWLVVSDLHLGKSERMARRGGALLPPYESVETLRRLHAEIAELDPRRVISLGDSFDDDAAARGTAPEIVTAIAALADGRDWLWITGNHDPDPRCDGLPGETADDLRVGAVTLRHQPIAEGPDISGHYHPVVRLAGMRRRAALVGARHIILPAFGAYTGGLEAEADTVTRWVPEGFAVACVHKALPIPLRGRLRA